MGLRFRKSFKIMPGVRINLGKRGASISVGPRGMKTTVNTSGRVTQSFGLPGTGLSWSESRKLGGEREDIDEKRTVRPSGYPTEDLSLKTEQARKDFRALYRKSDRYIDWTQVALRDDYLPELKVYLQGIFSKDIGTYVGLFEKYDILEELTGYISNIEVGMNSGDSLSVNYDFDPSDYFPLNEMTWEKGRTADTVYALACLDIKIARDVFALLPVESIVVDSRVYGNFVLSVLFCREEFLKVNFSRQEPIKCLDRFENVMHLSDEGLLMPIRTLDGDE